MSSLASVAHQPPTYTKFKMKIIFVALALVAVAVAAPAAPSNTAEPVKILRSEFDQQPEGAYVFSFETENGITQNENGELKQVVDEENKPHTVVVVRGSYSYVNPEGKSETINYVADETGFHAEGDSIPKPARK
ncbi:larval cuticle protein 1-like [Plodia interpunctella]|uniref:larval cuticle protein 1-like n=1 Tax=Plodia interpunctella TaxID=58824 RepID=UPI002368ABF6|nr:larval cuticle protein 1-like [Plodia interpunctella]